MSPDSSHLVALVAGLHRERARLKAARRHGERDARRVWVAQREREIAAERAFLGMEPDVEGPELTDAELLAELI